MLEFPTIVPAETASLKVFDGANAVFLGIAYSTDKFTLKGQEAAINSFVENGGGLYFYAGVSNAEASDSQQLNSSVGKFGFEYSNKFNNLQSTSVNSGHPLSTCITTLKAGNGANVILTSPSGKAKLLNGQGNIGTIGYFDGSL